MEVFEAESLFSDLKIKPPATLLKVTYGSKELVPNQILTPSEVNEPPVLEWDVEPKGLYVVVMNDPDAPSRQDPKFREWHHWCVTNIPGKDISLGDVLSEYIGSAPPEGTGLHRYVIMVFKQVGKINFNEPKLSSLSCKDRCNWSIEKFVRKYKLGKPIAANFFQAEWDESVPEMLNQYI